MEKDLYLISALTEILMQTKEQRKIIMTMQEEDAFFTEKKEPPKTISQSLVPTTTSEVSHLAP